MWQKYVYSIESIYKCQSYSTVTYRHKIWIFVDQNRNLHFFLHRKPRNLKCTYKYVHFESGMNSNHVVDLQSDIDKRFRITFLYHLNFEYYATEEQEVPIGKLTYFITCTQYLFLYQPFNINVVTLIVNKDNIGDGEGRCVRNHNAEGSSIRLLYIFKQVKIISALTL